MTARRYFLLFAATCLLALVAAENTITGYWYNAGDCSGAPDLFVTDVNVCNDIVPDCTGDAAARTRTMCIDANIPTGSYFYTSVYSGADCVDGEVTRLDGSALGRCIEESGSYVKVTCEGDVSKEFTCTDNQCQEGCTEIVVPLGVCTNEGGMSSKYSCTSAAAKLVASLAATAIAGAAASFYAFF